MAAKAKKPSLNDAVLDAALDMAANGLWDTVTPASLAPHTGYGVGEIAAHYPTRSDIVRGLVVRTTERVLSQVKKVDPEDTAKDRLFELLMARFDLLNAHRDGITAILKASRKDPVALACHGKAVNRAMTATLAAAGIAVDGLEGMAKSRGLLAVYLTGLRAWMKDETADMAPTMAALDKALTRADRVAQRMFTRGRGTKTDSDD